MKQRFQALRPIHVSLAVVGLCAIFHVASFFVPRLPVVSVILLGGSVLSFLKTRDLLATGFLKRSTSLYSLTPFWLKLLHPLAVAYSIANLWFTYLLRGHHIDAATHLTSGVLLPWGLFTLMIALAAERQGVDVAVRPDAEILEQQV